MRQFLLAILTILSINLPASADPWLTDGFQNAGIVIPKNASEELKATAKDFAALWLEATTKEITYGAENRHPIAIWLGRSVVPEDLIAQDEFEALGHDGFIIRSYSPNRRDQMYKVGAQLAIAGNTDRATRDGVFEYYFRFLKKRWFTPARANTVYFGNKGIPEADLRFVPEFLYREVGYLAQWRSEDGVESFRDHLHFALPVQASLRHLPASASDTSEFNGWNEALDTVPAWFRARVLDLESRKDTQLCAQLWNASSSTRVVAWTLNCAPGMQGLMEKLQVEPSQENMKSLVDLAEKTVAEIRALGQEETHAVRVYFAGTPPMPPEGVDLGGGVIPQLSNVDCDFSRPLSDKHVPENARFIEALEAWAAVAPAVMLSDHICSLQGAFVPFPNFDIIQRNLYTYARIGVKGIHMESWDMPELQWSELDRVRAYVASCLLWNPDQVVEDLVREIVQGEFGPAADDILAYIKALTDGRRKDGLPMHVMAPTEWALPATLDRAGTALGRAIKMKAPDEFDARVRLLLSPLEYAQLVGPPVQETKEDGARVWRRSKGRSMQETVDRIRARNLGDPAIIEPMLEKVVVDCGGDTPPREQPVVPGEPPK